MPRKLALIALPVLTLLLIAVLTRVGDGDADLRGKAADFILEHGDPSWGPLWDFASQEINASDRSAALRHARKLSVEIGFKVECVPMMTEAEILAMLRSLESTSGRSHRFRIMGGRLPTD